jgi:hypothetical protein
VYHLPIQHRGEQIYSTGYIRAEGGRQLVTAGLQLHGLFAYKAVYRVIHA